MDRREYNIELSKRKASKAVKQLYHYKKGYIGSFEKESDAEQLMKEIGGIFQWDNPNFDIYNKK